VLVIDDARSPFEFCLCDRVGYRRGGMALVSVRLCRLDIQALIHMGDAAYRFAGIGATAYRREFCGQ
jgi:hypothetical protein